MDIVKRNEAPLAGYAIREKKRSNNFTRYRTILRCDKNLVKQSFLQQLNNFLGSNKFSKKKRRKFLENPRSFSNPSPPFPNSSSRWIFNKSGVGLDELKATFRHKGEESNPDNSSFILRDSWETMLAMSKDLPPSSRCCECSLSQWSHAASGTLLGTMS